MTSHPVSSFKPLFQFPQLWFRLGIVALIGFSLFLRLWGLERFNIFVFDEVYYVKFAHNYLTQTPFFDGHPPLSKYLIALGIWLGEQVFTGAQVPRNELAGVPLSPLSYRWLNAITGTLIPLVVAGIAYQISHRRTFALIAGVFIALDGLFLVESRYALNNVYLVLFGLLGQWLLLMALNPQVRPRSLHRFAYLLASGTFFGASIAVKWNGLWFLLGIYLIWGCAWMARLLDRHRVRSNRALNEDEPRSQPRETQRPSIQNLTSLSLPTLLLYLGAVPVIVYSLIWIPHLKLEPMFGFWEVQNQILSYHQRVGGNEPSVHPYCSAWFTWPWMSRPVVYVYETARNLTEIVPIKPAPPATEVRLVYDVHAMGNPYLWWFSMVALLGLIWMLIQQWTSHLRFSPRSEASLILFTGPDLWIVIYVVLNYAASLLPWVRVTRCTFIYHYMGALVFATLGLAWVVDRWLQGRQQWQRLLGIAIIVVIGVAFVYWLPLFLGLPLSPEAGQNRRWLPTW
ncbi:dolichyl-phosphate-mannose--protein O-mannosyl transferase [Leptolyngbya sp. 'hensonii']|uniref:dolichyl-phosphate-mannose--protein mannosyltransferase n=1 Tax=Leptolyngbya sp. 'hensonii' TaxID=1922337 RepID=UPI00094FF8F5|nr:phospholipid carrier-dependent glycosyltransferase [Leptolyngbya sp. 'hensonii']OLP18153.1 dolichyl-phosphate-mannose--protein O-mannosyl transferase [Leptolyngbya sp. 'hensonii']